MIVNIIGIIGNGRQDLMLKNRGGIPMYKYRAPIIILYSGNRCGRKLRGDEKLIWSGLYNAS